MGFDAAYGFYLNIPRYFDHGGPWTGQISHFVQTAGVADFKTGDHINLTFFNKTKAGFKAAFGLSVDPSYLQAALSMASWIVAYSLESGGTVGRAYSKSMQSGSGSTRVYII